MAISPFKTFAAGEVLTAADLNSSFTQITNNGVDLWSPATKAVDLDGNEIVLDSDADTSITADTDDRIDFRVAGQDLFRLDGTATSPVNGLDFVASATGNDVAITAIGTDTNINIDLQPKGSGSVLIGGGSSGLFNVVEDTTPQLGGQLDVNGNAIGDGTLELLAFTETGSAVNHVQITNAATSNNPLIDAAGDDTNVGLRLRGKGTGTVQIGDADLSFPDSDGTADFVLGTNGSGTLSFRSQNLIQQVNTLTGAVATGTTAMALDDTIPQNTEGTEFITLVITPTDTNSKLEIEVVFCGSNSLSDTVIVALFQDSTADALATCAEFVGAAGGLTHFKFTHHMTAGTTSATTFKVRAGAPTGTITFNGVGAARRFGGVMASSITIREIAA